MTDSRDLPPQDGSPALGRFLLLVLLALFVMVGLGVYGIWSYAHREKDWRDRVHATETFLVPTNPPPTP